MIYISQGHEGSIGLEVFIKSFLQLGPDDQKKFILVCFKKSLLDTMNTLSMPFVISKNKLKIVRSELSCLFLPPIPSRARKTTQSTASLLHCLKLLEGKKRKGILVTLPTSKDQLFWKGSPQSGHTELLRSYFGEKHLPMVFLSPHLKVMVATDHIPVKKISVATTTKLIIDKVTATVEGLAKNLNSPLEEVLFAGINPHCGEGGSLGTEDGRILKAISALKIKFPSLSFKGPFPGDTLFFHRKEKIEQLFVYMYHDQGLGIFKSQNGLLGINITLGLPFLRMSVDHGTAFELKGRNMANATGSLYLLKEALKIQ